MQFLFIFHVHKEKEGASTRCKGQWVCNPLLPTDLQESEMGGDGKTAGYREALPPLKLSAVL